MSAADDALARVRQFYSEAGTRTSWPWRHWSAHPLVERRINQRISGSPDQTFLHVLVELLPDLGLPLPAARAASLGCGRGRLDRDLYRQGIVRSLDGFDLSPDSINAASSLAHQAGIRSLRYEAADLNQIELEPGLYDFVFCEMSLHHVEALERLFDQIALSLRAGGLLIVNEYVGPTRFRWTGRQMQLVNGLLAMLTERQRTTPEGIVKPLIGHLPESFFETNDPSESIRSADVVPCLEQRFAVRWRRDYGGTLLHPLLHDIACNFPDGDPLSESFLEAAASIEESSLAAGELNSDFAVLIASPR